MKLLTLDIEINNTPHKSSDPRTFRDISAIANYKVLLARYFKEKETQKQHSFQSFLVLTVMCVFQQSSKKKSLRATKYFYRKYS